MRIAAHVLVLAVAAAAAGCAFRPGGEARRAQAGVVELGNMPPGTTQVSVIEVRPVPTGATSVPAPSEPADAKGKSAPQAKLGAQEMAVAEHRAAFATTVRERFAKLDDRVSAVASRANAAGARARSAVSADQKDYVQRRDAIVERLAALSAVPAERWTTVAEDIERQVDDTEGIVDRMNGQLP